jgi:hypothetical protein
LTVAGLLTAVAGLIAAVASLLAAVAGLIANEHHMEKLIRRRTNIAIMCR